jgi:hypothetical protein
MGLSFSGPLGFNIAYDFSNSDRDCSIKQLRVFLDKYDQVLLKDLNPYHLAARAERITPHHLRGRGKDAR